jgi:hypothetical protein
VLFSFSTGCIDLQASYEIEESKEMNKMGPVSCKTVAGRESYGRSKVTQRKRENRGERERNVGWGLGFPEMETLNSKLAIYSKFFPNFRRP